VGLPDWIAIADWALKAYERALEPKRLVMVEGGQFDPFLGDFVAASGAAIGWFKARFGCRNPLRGSKP
jgi:hypothetical protein